MSSKQKVLSAENVRSAAGETISELAHRHMLNEHHTTTDEELGNARFEFSDKLEAGKTFPEVDNEAGLAPLPLETVAS